MAYISKSIEDNHIVTIGDAVAYLGVFFGCPDPPHPPPPSNNITWKFDVGLH